MFFGVPWTATMLFRVRMTSFLTGFAVAGGIAMYYLQGDIQKSSALVAGEVGALK